MAKKPETVFWENVVKRDLFTLKSAWFFKSQEMAKRGIPDVIVCIGGQFITLELKKSDKPEDQPDPLQMHTLEMIADAGGLAMICYPENWAESFALLKKLEHENRKFITNEGRIIQ